MMRMKCFNKMPLFKKGQKKLLGLGKRPKTTVQSEVEPNLLLFKSLGCLQPILENKTQENQEGPVNIRAIHCLTLAILSPIPQSLYVPPPPGSHLGKYHREKFGFNRKLSGSWGEEGEIFLSGACFNITIPGQIRNFKKLSVFIVKTLQMQNNKLTRQV